MYYELRWFSNRPEHDEPYCFSLVTFESEKVAVEEFNKYKENLQKTWDVFAKHNLTPPVASMLQLVARDDQATWLDEVKLWEA